MGQILTSQVYLSCWTEGFPSTKNCSQVLLPSSASLRTRKGSPGSFSLLLSKSSICCPNMGAMPGRARHRWGAPCPGEPRDPWRLGYDLRISAGDFGRFVCWKPAIAWGIGNINPQLWASSSFIIYSSFDHCCQASLIIIVIIFRPSRYHHNDGLSIIINQ